MIKNFLIFKDRKSFLVLILFSLIFITGIFLRSFHFSDWLIFQSDQSRDALIIRTAVMEGFDKLPLIGPQARGSALHLGPIFYYFQYFSGKIFGPSPESFAYPDLFFGILTIPLLFLFLRNFVSDWIALGTSFLASISLFLVTFSRFAWNPNSLAFFSTLLALLLIHALRNDKKRVWYLSGLAICAGIIFQLHFIAALSLSISFAVFLMLFHPLKWKEILICILIILFIQTPTFLYEIRNKGAVSEAFLETVEEKGSQNDSHMIHEKIFRAYQSQAEIFWIIATGQQNTDIILTRGFSLKCDKECEEKLPMTILSLLLFSFLIWIGFQKWKKEKNVLRKQILAFLGIWFLSFFFIIILVAYQISTRFYLCITPLIFLIFAFLIERLTETISNRFIKFLFFIMFLFSAFLNIQATVIYLQELSWAKTISKETHKDLVFRNEQKVTLEQLRSMAAETDYAFPDNNPVFISGESRYVRSLYYILYAEKGRKGCYQKGSVEDEFVFQNHAMVVKNKGQDGIIPFGTLAIRLFNSKTEQKNNLLPKGCLTY